MAVSFNYFDIVDYLFQKYIQDNKKEIALKIINDIGNHSFKKIFNAKILVDKLNDVLVLEIKFNKKVKI